MSQKHVFYLSQSSVETLLGEARDICVVVWQIYAR